MEIEFGSGWIAHQHCKDGKVGVIRNLVHSSPNIKKEVILAGALQPVIGLLSSCYSKSQREAALLLGRFAVTDSDCKVHIVQRGVV
ncbi:ARM REPEAT PROTEIN INTERACTING WITH ABF2-like isoform X1 [Trifolium pratense]|uniref:ARM REPEAT PROTEIN INTERACTING WITH ABF2-like isoform X1 n=1 Tax=Trifolium pratense TaxID=57577 RepID=UPI001E691231|nr:ARM REPEAT PROTEIN INTERACTING WITH ABF2-like isoform X1 [Trifolium pratense]XP_045804777.1 ARM REPEAT PROTEIN INTERACTING WITH ABF2-like isoform X1 [Trifolium pratense]